MNASTVVFAFFKKNVAIFKTALARVGVSSYHPAALKFILGLLILDFGALFYQSFQAV